MIRGSELHDLVGNESVLCILKTYLLLQIKKIEPARLNFSELNVPSSGFVLSSLMVEFNLSSFITKSAWLMSSILCITRQLFKSYAA
jgi:hypothetical protein